MIETPQRSYRLLPSAISHRIVVDGTMVVLEYMGAFMKRLLLLSALILGAAIASTLKSDVIAYLPLYHPIHKTHVHFLLEYHATTEIDSKAINAIQRTIYEIKQNVGNGSLTKQNAIPLINTQMRLLKEQCNLMTQQNALAHMCKHYPVSLINEDALLSSLAQNEWYTSDGTDKLAQYLQRNIGLRKPNDLAEGLRYNISPMWGLGTLLFNGMRPLDAQCIKIPNCAGYYYNTDTRITGPNTNPNDTALIDKRTIRAIHELRTTYNQKDIIVILGGSHVIKVARHLCSQKGYCVGPLRISSTLTTMRSTNHAINRFFKNIESLTPCDQPLASTDNWDPTDTSYVVTILKHPLDIRDALEEGMKVKKPERSLTRFSPRPRPNWNASTFLLKGASYIGSAYYMLNFLAKGEVRKALAAFAAMEFAWWVL